MSAPSSHRFHGVQRTPLPSGEALTSKASPTPATMMITVQRPPSPRAGTPKTQREVSKSLRERILNIERKKMYGSCSSDRPRFQVTKRVDPSLLRRQDSMASIPAPPASVAASARHSGHHSDDMAVSSASNSVAASTKPPFQIRPSRRTIYDIQVSAARTESLQHTEPYVRIRPFAKILRLPADEATEYVEAELEAGYYKRWVYNVEGKRPDMPQSLEQFFGNKDDFEAQDEVAIKEWKERIIAAAADHSHQHTPQKK
jgi:hypothetical protein